MHHFETQLKKGNRQGWTYVDIPVIVSGKLNKKGKVYVCGQIDNMDFHSSFLPKGDETHYLFVKQVILKSICKPAGDFVAVKPEEDTQPHTVDMPDDMFNAINDSHESMTTFTKFPYSYKKELMDWINDAKKPETRMRRIVKAVLMLENYKKLAK